MSDFGPEYDAAMAVARTVWERAQPLRPFGPDNSPEGWMILAAHEALNPGRLLAALDDLVSHGDLTPSGRIVLQRILGGES
ncbi:hypothetical protein [Gordonia alkanivorans]|uniref:hypothetical protein n=1 Tax=Gordonia alkanivorans TaxID=84096 RepID=UPI0024B86CC4|nr:hypothetical protein [Gordonia alkanivorans]MDJ0010143.1 hypothetical protein [Gordonia alkanivorans]MDJ0495667.1 hypothetical protein [Gordonia alkanivorans]